MGIHGELAKINIGMVNNLLRIEAPIGGAILFQKIASG
jgi:hypothetical protein